MEKNIFLIFFFCNKHNNHNFASWIIVIFLDQLHRENLPSKSNMAVIIRKPIFFFLIASFITVNNCDILF